MPSELVVEYGPAVTNECRPTRERAEYQAMSRLLRVVDAVKAWAPTVENRLLKAYLTPRPEGGLRLIGIARRIADENSLHDALLQFSDELFEAGCEFGVNVYPDGTDDELQAFFDPNSSLLFSWR